MHNVDDAIQQLAGYGGLRGLKLDEKGDAAIRIGERSVYLMKIADNLLEVSTRLPFRIEDLPTHALQRLLAANAFGVRTGARRIGADPSDGQILLSERVDVRPMDVVMLLDRLGKLADVADAWSSPARRAALVRPVGLPAEPSEDADNDPDGAEADAALFLLRG